MSDPSRPPFQSAVSPRSRLRSWWTGAFLKRRLVLAIDTISGSTVGVDEVEGYSLVVHGAGLDSTVSEECRQALAAVIGGDRLRARFEDSRLKAFLIVRDADGNLGGFVWSLAPRTEEAWHDSVIVQPGAALLFNGYVFPEHRRKRLFTAMMVAAQDHCLDQGSTHVIGVVEASNIASRRTLKGLGYRHVGNNYLVKILGRNVVSVFMWTDDRPFEAHLVLRTRKGITL